MYTQRYRKFFNTEFSFMFTIFAEYRSYCIMYIFNNFEPLEFFKI